MSIEDARKILDEKYRAGTRITNCLMHGGSLAERPDNCRLCLTDLRNELSFAIRVNQFLNDMLARAQAALTETGVKQP
jgi:hypothetical protein